MKYYLESYQADMVSHIARYIRMHELYVRDLARANRIETDLLTLSDSAIYIAHDLTNVNPRDLIIELRNSKYVYDALVDIARAWRHTSITKDQRALLGKSAIQQIKAIYKTL